jgi:hypothetical protein
VAFIDSAAIAEAEREKIAWGNAERMSFCNFFCFGKKNKNF